MLYSRKYYMLYSREKFQNHTILTDVKWSEFIRVEREICMAKRLYNAQTIPAKIEFSKGKDLINTVCYKFNWNVDSS